MELGPSDGDLTVHTHRDGVAALAGHDLVLLVTDWSAQLELGHAPRLELTAVPASLEVREAHGGAKPLTDRDRRDIRRNLVAKVLGDAPVRFRSTAAEGLTLTGELTAAGRTALVEVRLTVDGATVTGEARVTHSALGLRPYSALLGTLKVADAVEVRFSGTVAP